MTRRDPLTLDQLFTILLFIVIAFAACFTPAQNDTWWHLRAGAETWRAGRVQLVDTFSHTAYGAYWPNQEWLGEVVLYGLYKIGGLPVMTAFAAALATASWVLIWRVTPGRDASRIALCATALMICTREWSLRPKIFTLFFVALTVFLVARRRHIWLPLLFLLWANLHGGVMLGVVIVGASAIAAAATEKRLVGPLVWTAAACLIATIATPLGLSLWGEIARSLVRIRQYGIQEWAPTPLFDPLFLPFWIVSSALVALTIALRPWRVLGSTVLLAPALALLPLAVRANRNVAPALMVAVPALAALLDRRFPRRRQAPRRLHPAFSGAAICAVLIIALSGVAYAWTGGLARLGWHPIPAAAADAVSSCPERLYNRYDEGGFLIWFAPRQKVFLDGRQDPYPPELVLEQKRVEASGDYVDLFDRYSIRCAFLPREARVTASLERAGWLKRYGDQTWIVLVRP